MVCVGPCLSVRLRVCLRKCPWEPFGTVEFVSFLFFIDFFLQEESKTKNRKLGGGFAVGLGGCWSVGCRVRWLGGWMLSIVL